ncbi:FAD-dependent oxidoreductase [Anaerobacillus isosaccharinicus]|uniref:FAD-dependent oxidoreductase n=1 Tax=Anaerobacillus isosaccharinicus TaxID=1532552 RepID=A0A1S2LL50_9BACI|nr:FAD-dependent oxidoreductase [Anaerobacillus isosaccharinicus]MBA5586147.1 FAD-dependent oxidoreductase [Anaerobacillus isosaccharinicus]QOY35586.1 FAD-dependent oxidoreductase [Anaerobacillus isosaccharinicus]
MSSYQEVEVVIIGAGFAGLAAAFELKKQNISFVVLEARNRPGGRVYSIKTADGVTIDMGAQWIDKDHHRINKLLSQFKLKTVSTFKKGKDIYNINGKKVISKKPPLSAPGLLDLFQATTKLNKVSKQINLNAPWCSLEAKKYDGQTMEQLLIKTRCIHQGAIGIIDFC